MITLKPDMVDGTVVALNDVGDPVGIAQARPSRTIPGYVTLVSSVPLGHAIRVPADWLHSLEEVARRSALPPVTAQRIARDEATR